MYILYTCRVSYRSREKLKGVSKIRIVAYNDKLASERALQRELLFAPLCEQRW